MSALPKSTRPEPTLPNPNVNISGGLPLWAGVLIIALLAVPLVFLIVSGIRQ